MPHQPRTLVDPNHLPTMEVESLLASRLMGDPFLGSLLEEMCHRQIDKEHARLEVANGREVIESQGIIRGTRYFLALRLNEQMKREAIDPAFQGE